jgi:hypothetical protein
MSIAITFDTLQLAKTLEAKGFKTEQAEGISIALKEALQGTERALHNFQEEIKTSKTDLATKADLQEIRAELKAEIADAKSELIKWNFAAIVAAAGLAVAIAQIMK